METIRDRVVGLDVHRDRVVGCVRLVEGGGRVKTVKRSFSTMTGGVAELAGWLGEHEVATAVMESTGVYWKPIYYGRPFEEVARAVILRRVELGLTQQSLAERMDTTTSVTSRIESGQHRVATGTLRRLAEVLAD